MLIIVFENLSYFDAFFQNIIMETNKRTGARKTGSSAKRRKEENKAVESFGAKQETTFDRLPRELRFMIFDLIPECIGAVKMVSAL